MTHSHDTSTPAMSDETVPSEEFVLVPRDRGQTFSNSTLPTEMITAGMEVLERADDDLAGRNGEDVPDWDYGMEAVAVYRAMVAAAPAPKPSPALAKGGDAVREIANDLERSAGKPLVEGSWGGLALEPVARAIAQDRGALSTPTEGPASVVPVSAATYDVLDEAKINALPLPLIARFAGDKDWLPIHDIGIDAPLCRIDVSGKLEPRRFSEIMELKDGDGVIHNPDDFYLDADTPTEGPASQTEGMGEEALRDVRLDSEKAEEWPAAQKALWRVVTGENLNDGHYINAYRLTEKLYAAIAALTPPETAEAVSVASDPAPATDDRERLVEALRAADSGLAAMIRLSEMGLEESLREPEESGNFASFEQAKRCLATVRAALATEASQ